MATNSDLELKLRISADLRAAREQLNELVKALNRSTAAGRQLGDAGSRAARGVDDAAAAGRRLGDAGSRASRGLDSAADSARKADASFSKTRKGVESISAQLTRLQNIAGALTGLSLGAGLIKNLSQTSDEYTNLTARLRIVTASSEDALTTLRSVAVVANVTGQKISAAASLYTRLAQSLKGAASQTELLRVVETISKAAIVSGATATESEAAIIQLSQGLASGVLRGEEYNSVSEQMPRIMDMLAKSLGKTRGELRAMAADGKLTTEVVFRALQQGAAGVDSEFAQMPLTISSATTQFKNAWTLFVGGANESSGAATVLASSISALAGNLDILMAALTGVVVLIAGRKIAAMTTAAQASAFLKIQTIQLAAAEVVQSRAAVQLAQAELARARASLGVNNGARLAAENALTAALARQTAAENALNAAHRARSFSASLGSGLMGLAGGPVGLAITGVALAVAGLASAYSAAQKHEQELEQQHRQTVQTLDDQRQKTLSLMDAQNQLHSTTKTSDVLALQRSNGETLGIDKPIIDALEKQRKSLQTKLASLTSRPDFNGLDLVQIGSLEKSLAAVEKQLGDLQPKFNALTQAQDGLSAGLNERLTRALNNTDGSGKSLRETLNELFPYGTAEGTRFGDELAAAVGRSEQSFLDLKAEADALRPKLEKELKNATYSASQQLEQLRDNIVAAAAAAGHAPADLDKLRDSMNALVALQKQADDAKEAKKREQQAESEAKSRQRAAASAAKAAEDYVSGLEKQAASVGKTAAQVRAFELAEKGLSAALRTRAESALAVVAAAERQQQADANTARNISLQAQFLRASGDESGAALAEMRQEMAVLRREFEKSGNTDGIAWLDKLIPVQETRIRVDALKKQIDDLQTWRGQRETSVQAQITSGLLSEIAGRRELVNLNKEVVDKMTGYLPELKQIANLPGEAGAGARAAIADIESQMNSLKTVSDGLAAAFSTGLQDGIEGSLNELAAGTANLADAVLNLGKSVVSALAQVASRNLAEAAMGGLDTAWTSLSGGAVNAATDAATETATATANAATYATAITTASTTGAAAMGTTLTAGVTGLSTSFAAGSATLTTSLAGAFATGAATLSSAIIAASAGSAASSGVASAAVAAATGGHIRGPGTGTSDSIPARLSDGEFVVKAASVRRYGVDYLHALNAGRLGAFADGGPVSMPAFSPKRVNMTAPASMGADAGQSAAAPAPLLQQTLVLDPAEALSAGINTSNGKRSLITFISVNKQTLRQTLGIK